MNIKDRLNEIANESKNFGKQKFESFKEDVKSRKLPLVPHLFGLQHEQERVQELIDSCSTRHDIPHGSKVPKDLDDKQGTWQLTKDGYPVVGVLLPEEFAEGDQSPAAPLYLALAPILFTLGGLTGWGAVTTTLAVAYIIGFALIFRVNWLLAGAVILALALGQFAMSMLPSEGFGQIATKASSAVSLAFIALPALYYLFKSNKRAKKLYYNAKVNSQAAMNAPKANPNEARFIQASNSAKDKSYFIEYGKSTGSLSVNGDLFAPDKDLPFGHTTNDVATHILYTGATGSGKTSAIRVLIDGVVKEEQSSQSIIKNGICVMDGKATLAKDCGARLDAIFSPETMKNLNPFEGISPAILSKTLYDLNVKKGSESGNSAYFNNSARDMVFATSVIHQALHELGKRKSSVAGFQQTKAEILSKQTADQDMHPIIQAIQDHPDFTEEGTLLMDAINKFAFYQSQDGEAQQGIVSTVESWLAPFFQSELIRHWADCEVSDYNIEEVLHGAKYGIDLPETKYGQAGVIISRLLKARLFKAIERRGERWKVAGQSRVYLFVDECQRLMDEQDSAMIAIARGFGLTMVYATQSIEEFYSTFGQDKSKATLNNYVNFIALASSDGTLNYYRELIGKSYIWKETAKTGSIAYSLYAKMEMSLPKYDENNPNRFWMRRFGYTTSGFIAKGLKHLNTKENDYPKVMISDSPEYIVQDRDLQSVKTSKGMALCQVMRGGYPRRDIVQLHGLDQDFKPYPSSTGKLEKLKEEFAE